MNLWVFSLYTFIGALIWNTFLLWLGVKLGEHWDVIKHYTIWLDIVVVIALAVGVVYLYTKLKAHRSTA